MIKNRIISYVEAADRTDTLEANVGLVVEAIRVGFHYDLKERTLALRKLIQVELDQHGDLKKAKLAASELKKHLPAVTWSGTFSSRADDKLMQHSGLICADLDGLEARLDETKKILIEKSPFLAALFISPSGDGLKAIFECENDPKRHYGAFLAVEEHVRELTGVQIDQKCKNLSRLCFLAHDPNIYLANGNDPVQRTTTEENCIRI